MYFRDVLDCDLKRITDERQDFLEVKTFESVSGRLAVSWEKFNLNFAISVTRRWRSERYENS